MYIPVYTLNYLLRHLANAQTAVLFILGVSNETNEQTKKNLIEESNIHGDIILVDGLTEHYNFLTLKTLYTIKFFLKQGK